MYDVMDIACYVINKSNKWYGGITYIRLRSLLYFIQANYVIREGRGCFKERIVAFPMGVHIDEVYNEYKIRVYRNYGNIESITTYGIMDTVYDEAKIKESDKMLIVEVLEIMLGYTDDTLIEIIKSQDTWKEAIAKGIGTEITLQAMDRFFKD